METGDAAVHARNQPISSVAQITVKGSTDISTALSSVLSEEKERSK